VLGLVIVMGLMQGVQVKLAADEFREQRRLLRSSTSKASEIPSTMPATFYIKTMDGLFEGAVFSFVSVYAVLKHNWAIFGPDKLDTYQELETYQIYILGFSAATSFLSMGCALTELDYRTSAAVQRNMNPVTMYLHFLFRASEITWRSLTGLIFCCVMRVHQFWWVAFVLMFADYLLSVIILLAMGGRDPLHHAAWCLGVPMILANVMQFVDTPGLSLQADRISKMVVPIRILEFIGVVVFCSLWDSWSSLVSNIKEKSVWEFLWIDQPVWLMTWAVATVLYFILSACYASRVQKDEDLHMAVAYGKLESLRRLIIESDLVLDINRYGPDGRTPLHLASMRGQVDCMKLLIEQGADVKARTSDRKQQTVLHLAVMNTNCSATRYLCRLCMEASFLNAQNSDGDTALHVAARRQNVTALKALLRISSLDLNIRNRSGQVAADCAPSDKFGFDRDSSECAIAEIFRLAEAGIRPSAQEAQDSECELSADPVKAHGHSSDKINCPSTLQSTDAPTERNEKLVPLIPVKKNVEEDLRRRQAGIAGSSIHGASPVTNCGISSFMLSAGMGALSRFVLYYIKEDDLYACVDMHQVKVSFEDFVEIKDVAEGAFGKVLLVKHRETQEEFAMKLMDKAKFRAQKITSKAVSEQYILKTTRFPFIVALQYAFQGSTFWALVMEYCPNGDLQDLLVKRGSPGLKLFDVARLSGEVLLALEHLHKIHVIFRDLKLENVVLCPKFRAKLTDFGLAKKLYTATDARTMCGSYGYAAPEIMSNKQRYDYSVDLYSLGVMMYMLLSGGDQATNNPKQRLPPMQHPKLKRKLRDAAKRPNGDWATDGVGALKLLETLTSDDPKVRKTAREMKKDPFFVKHLNHTVDYLLEHADHSYLDPPRTGSL
jgi:hypothetical protein